MTSQMNNGISLTENDDGSFTLEWDQYHPVWSMFNNMTSEEINSLINDAIEKGLKKYDA